MTLQSTGSWDPIDGVYSISLCWEEGPCLSFDDLERGDLEELQSLVELLLMSP